MKKKILIAGQEGMVGSAIYNSLKKVKSYKIINCPRKKLDLTNSKSVEKWFKKNKPQIVINCAGKVGGILDNSKYQDEYLYINTTIGLNLVKMSLKYNVKKLINLGSACIYPKKTNQPIKEEYLLSSYLEKTNEGYALAKITGVRLAKYYNEKFSTKIICPMICNIYGTNDNFDFRNSHVLSALIRRFVEAKKSNQKKVVLWGSGNPKREFMHVSDAAKSLIFLMKNYNKVDPINVGTGKDLSINQLARKISKIVGYKGKVLWDKTKPDGVKRKLLDISKFKKLGFKNKVSLDDGIKLTINEFINLKKK